MIGACSSLWEQLGDIESALAVFLERERALEQRAGIRKEGLDVETLWRRLQVPACQFRFRVKAVDLADPATHEQRDHCLRFGVEVGGLRGKRICGGQGGRLQLFAQLEVKKGQSRDSSPESREPFAPG